MIYLCPIIGERIWKIFGLHPMYKEFKVPEKTLPVNSNIPFSDCTTVWREWSYHLFAEYSLPFSSARKIVDLPKEIMRNPKAANKFQVA